MSNKIKSEDINRIIWQACDTFRGVIDPSQYKDYILVMLFLKYVSDTYTEKYEAHLIKYEGDIERAQRAMASERFTVPEHSHFNSLYDKRNEPNIGELIDIALADLEDANREKLTSSDGAGIFRNISFNSSNLGDKKDKNARLKNLLTDFNKLDVKPSSLDGQDVLGDTYEFLISNFASDAGKKAGEFYTPKEVSTLLARLTKSKSGARIYDPTCGSASLLIKAGQQVEDNNFSLYGQEANGSTWALAMMNMFLHGFDNASIRWGDTLRNPKHTEGDNLMKFDTVVANPPFSLDKWGQEEAEEDKYNRFNRGVPPKSKGDWAFISHMIESAYETTGMVGVVVPHGVLFRGSAEGRIRKHVIEDNLLDAVIGLPANLFFGTGIPAAILIFNKAKDKRTETLFIDASEEYDSGKNQNVMSNKHLDHIVETYTKFRENKTKQGVLEDKYSYVAALSEITENEYNLNIPRYVDTFEEEAEINITQVQTEISTIENELVAVQQKMQEYLKELSL
ncbi:type I restriction-modification system subunit M [Polaribacter glomeratus]|uniref:site-specific DNA-methyltransferase (adenine-specific) n=1 Tax=Polaribacter glomeratus TaxID=102 RepID=A0A2S7WGH5_9FLAO|nr:type I restriction-modification system subunit M [Polaribacter glomeratus]PQJ76411.1 type I restriction-modification system subunit M [Polaribacter glomeratus]TXD65544.1 type I restriction-modification system subunit M [Polaribacter glomeratus]